MLARPEGGTIVTVASVLGHLGASHLTDYAAAKAALIPMHTSLQAEAQGLARTPDAPPGAKNIRFILVKPGQLLTPLFGELKTPNSFLGPEVEPKVLAKKIVEMVEEGRGGVIAEPLYARYIEWVGILPHGLQKMIRLMSGVDTAMATVYRGV